MAGRLAFRGASHPSGLDSDAFRLREVRVSISGGVEGWVEAAGEGVELAGEEEVGSDAVFRADALVFIWNSIEGRRLGCLDAMLL